MLNWPHRIVTGYEPVEIIADVHLLYTKLDCNHLLNLRERPVIGSSRPCRSCGVAASGGSSSGGTTVDPVTRGGG